MKTLGTLKNIPGLPTTQLNQAVSVAEVDQVG